MARDEADAVIWPKFSVYLFALLSGCNFFFFFFLEQNCVFSSPETLGPRILPSTQNSLNALDE